MSGQLFRMLEQPSTGGVLHTRFGTSLLCGMKVIDTREKRISVMKTEFFVLMKLDSHDGRENIKTRDNQII